MNGIMSKECIRTSFHSQTIPGAVVQLPLQVVPHRMQSVNGSNVTMGCAIPVTSFSNVSFCGNIGSGGGIISYLVDGNSPVIDTSRSTSDWASQLMTVRWNEKIDIFVALPFGFDTAMSLISI